MSFGLETKTLTLAGAEAAADAAMARAREAGVAVTIAVLDQGGAPLLLRRMDGVHTGTVEVALAKARSAVKFRRSTASFAESVGKGNLSLIALPDVMPFPGGLPLMLDGSMAGAIGISGASPAIDGDIAAAGAAAVASGR